MTTLAASAPASAAIIPFAARQDSRPLRFITCGSVDDGKSTLIGRLLWDTKTVKDDHVSALEGRTEPRQNDLGLPDFALLLDGLQAEREQGITIDVAYRYFATGKRSFIVADTPGHEQYTRNMATGASTADLAILLVDARAGLVEQTRRHAAIAALMGIRQFILAVNKIDLVGYDQARFDSIADAFHAVAAELSISGVTAIPVSALKGENVVTPSGASMPWYRGPTLVEALEAAPARSAAATGLRFSVQRVARIGESFRGYQGSVTGGSVRSGDEIVVLPSGRTATVKEVVAFDPLTGPAKAGDAVTLVLDRQVDVARGDIIAGTADLPAVGRAFHARMVALQPEGVQPGKRYWLKSGARRQRVTVTAKSVLDLSTRTYRPADRLPMNAIGEVDLAFEEPAIFDAYEQNRATGAFILIDPATNNTAAGGMVSGLADLASATEGTVSISLPRDLLDRILALDFVQARIDEVRVR